LPPGGLGLRGSREIATFKRWRPSRTVICQALLPEDDAGGRDGLDARTCANAQALGAHFQAAFDPLDGSAQARHGGAGTVVEATVAIAAPAALSWGSGLAWSSAGADGLVALAAGAENRHEL